MQTTKETFQIAVPYGLSSRAIKASLFSILLLVLSLAICIQLHHAHLERGALSLIPAGLKRRDNLTAPASDEPLLLKSLAQPRKAGIHKRALDNGLVCTGQSLISQLNNKDHDTSNRWPLTTNIGNTGWVIAPFNEVDGENNPTRLTEGAAVLGELEVDTTVANWVQRRTSNLDVYTKPNGQTVAPTLAYAKQWYHASQGTVLVEDIVSPAEMLQAQTNQIQEIMPGADAADYGITSPAAYASNPLDLQSWSDLTFLTAGQQAGTAAVRNLRRVIQSHVTNPITLGQINAALQNREKTLGSVMTSAEVFSANTEEAAAIFATPNGKGSYWLLKQHSADVGEKTLGQISIFATTRDGKPHAWMILDFIDSPGPQTS